MSGIQFNMEPNKNATFLRNLNKIQLGIQSRSQQVLLDVAKDIMQRSREMVPEMTSTLINTAFIEAEQYRRSIISVRLGYGGTSDLKNPITGQMASEYAIYVHERLDVVHPKGQAKFLEAAINEYGKELPEELQKAFASMFRGGMTNV